MNEECLNWIDFAFVENKKLDRWNEYEYDDYYRDVKEEYNDYEHDDYSSNLDMSDDDIINTRINIEKVFRYFYGRETYSEEELFTYVRNGEFNMHCGNTELSENNVTINTKLRSEFDSLLYKYHKDDITRFGSYSGITKNTLFICNRCGNFIYKTGKEMLSTGCRICDSNKYNGEELIKELLSNIGLKYKTQYSDGCVNDKTNRELPYDFIIYNNGNKFYLEIQGLQHYQPIDYFGGEDAFESQKYRDSIKKLYAENNGVYIELDYRESNLKLLKERFMNKLMESLIK